MTFAQLQDRIEALITLGGWSNVQPEPDLGLQVNEGLRLFSSRAQHNMEDVTITTVIGQTEYTLLTGAPADTRGWIILFDDATYGTTTVLPQTTQQILRGNNRLWRQAASATPQFWYWRNINKVGLYPPPSGAGTIVYFRGVRHEPELTLWNDVPLAPPEFHEAIALYGAWQWGKLYSRQDERAVAVGYKSEADSIVDEFRSRFIGREANLLVRRVARAPQEYLDLGSTSPSTYVR